MISGKYIYNKISLCKKNITLMILSEVNPDLRRQLALAASILALALAFSIHGIAQDVDPPTIEMVTEFPIVIFEGDEVVVEARKDQAEEVASVVVREMTLAGAEMIHSIPCPAEAKISECWVK